MGLQRLYLSRHSHVHLALLQRASNQTWRIVRLKKPHHPRSVTASRGEGMMNSRLEEEEFRLLAAVYAELGPAAVRAA